MEAPYFLWSAGAAVPRVRLIPAISILQTVTVDSGCHRVLTRAVIVDRRHECVQSNGDVGGGQRLEARHESFLDVRPVERDEHDDDGGVDGLA